MACLTDTASLDDIARACEQRAATYALISRMYKKEVDQEFYNELKATSFPAKTGDDDVDTGYRKIATYLSSVSHGALLELAVDYVRTFIGHRNDTHGAAYPFESVYTSEKRLLMQEARNEVLASFRKAGITVEKSWEDPEDHVGLEFEYMQIMATRAAQAAEKGESQEAAGLLAEQCAFFETHIQAWVPMLTQDMRRYAKTDFYQGLAWLTDGFMRLDAEFFEDVIEETEQPAVAD